MTSSRRSSHSTRSFKQPPWRSSSTSKNFPAASLSYVFAEPEQGAPLASATAKLPVTWAPSIRNENQVELLDESSENVAPLLPPNGQYIPVNREMTEGGVVMPTASSPSKIEADEVAPEILEQKATVEHSHLQPIEPETVYTSAATMSVNAIPFPASPTSHPNPSLPTLTTTLSAAPGKASWFRSFSRPIEKSSLSGVCDVESTAVVNGVDHPVEPTLNQSPGKEAEGPTTQPSLFSLTSSPPIDSTIIQSTMAEPVSNIPSHAATVSNGSGPQTIRTEAGGKRSWFSSSPSNLVTPSPNTRTGLGAPMLLEPPQAAGVISNIITPQPAENVEHVEISPPSDPSPPCSLDETVPPLPRTPPTKSTSLPQTTFGPIIDSSNLSSLNPTASRFTLSIPLLGRAKIPLESVLGTAKVKVNGSKDINVMDLPQAVDSQTPPSVIIASVPDTSGQSSELSPNTTDSDRPHQGAPVSNTTSPISLSNVTPSATDPDFMSVTPHPSTHNTESSSWWDYLTWSSAPLSGANPPIDPVPHTSSTAASPPSDPSIGGGNLADNNVSSPTIEPDVRSSETLPSTSLPPVFGISDSINATERVALPKDDNKLQQDDDNGKGPVAASSWYTPWAWYSSTTDAVLTRQEVDSCNEKLTEEVGVIEGAERVPAGVDSNGIETGRIDKAERVVEQEAPVPMEDKDFLVNPITQSMANQRTGWASFFSSRALLVKSIGYGNALAGGDDVKRDKHGNEVMELDSDDEGDPATRGKEGLDNTSKSADTTKGHTDKPLEVRNVGGRANGNAKENEKTGLGHQPTAPPLTISEDVRRETIQSNPANNRSTSGGSQSGSGRSTPVPSYPAPGTISSTSVKGARRTASPTPSKKSVTVPPPPNLVLPTWDDTFHTAPRNIFPPRSVPNDENVPEKFIGKTMKFVSGVLFAKETESVRKGKEREREEASSAIERERRKRYSMFGIELPRAFQAQQDARRAAAERPESSRSAPTKDLSESQQRLKDVADVMEGCKKVVVIGVHGWFPGAVMRTMLGEPTGTSAKFVNMMVQALEEFQLAHGVVLDKITKIPLEGEGTIDRRVERLYNNLLGNQSWLDDLHSADAIFFATHSQGSIVTTHLLDRLIRENHIKTFRNQIVVEGMETFPSAVGINSSASARPQKVCCLALCGIHLGPLRYLSSSSLVQPYIQYFESTAARELFEFQTTESDVSQAYVKALTSVLRHGTKMVYVASLNDQVVPIYSGLFTAASHPLILRALYIDGDAYHSSDFLSNLLVLLLRILNSGLSDSGLLAHLSEATAGSLNGVGHSTAYEELATYSLAVNYLFLTDDGLVEHPELVVESFNASHEQNDYEIPWALRDIIADDRVSHFFFREIAELRDAFREWQPKTTILRDLKRKLQPIQKLPSISGSSRM